LFRIALRPRADPTRPSASAGGDPARRTGRAKGPPGARRDAVAACAC